MRIRAAAIVFALLAVSYVVARPSPAPAPMPAEARALAARVAARPTDWVAASKMTEKALDLRVPGRVALWRASYRIAESLVPQRPEPRAAFARSGFFHWMELSGGDRKAVLEAYAPLLRDPATFDAMVHELYALTGDLDYLRRAAPPHPGAARMLAWLAATYGRFDDYRAIRDGIEARREAVPAEPPAAIERSRWSGLCGEDVCSSAWREIEARRSITLTLRPISSDDVMPYVEVYVDGARHAEGMVAGKDQTLMVNVGAPGIHRVEVRLANALTRNRERRRIRITSVRAV